MRDCCRGLLTRLHAPDFTQDGARPALSAYSRIAALRRSGMHGPGSRHCLTDSHSVCRSHPERTPRPGPRKSNRTCPLRRCPRFPSSSARGVRLSEACGLQWREPVVLEGGSDQRGRVLVEPAKLAIIDGPEELNIGRGRLPQGLQEEVRTQRRPVRGQGVARTRRTFDRGSCTGGGARPLGRTHSLPLVCGFSDGPSIVQQGRREGS